ncbi:MAG TPA: VCBS repeat-containing protein, partial [Candidatus Angelobacter sp.]|nr:VCBS repeat-containing protein [Candidatus Angelobacter sp.]
VFIPNLGLGNFGVPVVTNIAGLPGVIVPGDFNGDGKLDFVMATGQVQTFLGNGNGTFTPAAPQLFTGLSPQNLLVGDFNGDGKLDVIVPQRGQLIELLGNGDGTFAAPKTVISGILSFSDTSALFETADVNQDGRMDLIQRNGILDGPIPVFNIYLAQQDGSFVLQNSYSPYSGLPFQNGFLTPGQHSFVGDFNGDGIPDIAAFQSQPALPSQIYVQFLLGNGDGTFTPTFEKFPMGVNSGTLPNVVADMNSDGKADFVELDGFTSSYHVISSATGHSFQIQFASLPVIGATGQIHASIPVQAAQDTTLQLSSSDPAISVPASVTIPAGSLGADVNVTVGPAFDNSHTFSITATDGISTSTAVASVAVPGGSVGLISGFVFPPFRALLPGQTPIDFGGYALSSRGGYQTTVSIHCENLPPGATCQFGSTSLDIPAGGSNSTSFVLNLATPLPVGTYTFNVVASDGSISNTLTGIFQVGDFGIQFDSAGPSALATGSETFTVDLNSINNYEGVVGLTCSGLPAGATCLGGSGIFGISQSIVVGLSVQTTNVPVGDYPFVINGGTGFTTHGVNAVLHVGDFNSTSISPASASFNVGQSTTFNIALSAANGFNDQINLFCGNETVAGHFTGAIQCVFSPTSVTFDASGSATAQITVTALSHPTSAHVPAVASAAGPRWLAPVTLTLLLVGVLIAAPKKRKGALVLGCICLLTVSVMVACGGGGGGGSVGPTPTPTPVQPPQPQTVTVTVFGQPATNQGATKALGTFNVTVQ